METNKSLVRISYEKLHKFLNLHDKVEIESVFITDSDLRSNNITVKLSFGPYSRYEGEEMCFLSDLDLKEFQKDSDE